MTDRYSENNTHYIFSTSAIRDKAEDLFQYMLEGRTHFHLFPEKIDEVAHYIQEVTKKNYPEGNIPFHSRWGHFNVGGVERLEELLEELKTLDSVEQTKSKLDLVKEVPPAGKNSYLFNKIFNKQKTNITINMNDQSQSGGDDLTVTAVAEGRDAAEDIHASLMGGGD